MIIFKKTLLLFFILFHSVNSLVGQSNNFFDFDQTRTDKQYLDSLYNLADTTTVDTLKAICYLEISIALDSDPLKNYHKLSGTKYLEMAKDIALRNNKSRNFVLALDNIGVRNRRNGNFKTALRFHMAALVLVDSIHQPKIKSIILNNIGVVFRRIDNFQEALSYHLKALKIADSLNDDRTKAMAINSIGNVYSALDKRDEALRYFKQSLSLEYDRKNRLGIAINLNNIGSTYQAKGDLQKAYEYYLLSLDVNKEINSLKGIAICYSDIGDVYFDKNDFIDALNQYKKSEEIFKKTNDKIYLANSYLKAGKALVKLERPVDAQTSLQFALNISLKIGSKVISKNAYTWLSKAYKLQGDFKKALDNFERSNILQDSINNITIQKNIIRMQIKYDLESKETEIALLQQQQRINKLELKKQRTANLLMMVIIILILLVTIFLSYFIYTRNRKNKLLEDKNREIEKAREELKQYSDDLLIAKEQADRSNKSKTIFLANMSHEFRTPLNSVIGFTDLMLSQETDPEKKEKLSIVKSSSKSLLVLLNDILDLSKIEAGKLTTQMQPVNIVNIIEEIHKLFKINTDKKGIEFNCSIQKDFPKHIVFSEIRLRQILFNLIGNAVKFTNQGTIDIEALYDDTNKPGKIDFCIRISDTGTGIEKDDLDKIFKPFFQLSGNSEQQGTGLGLTITKRLIESMGGKIQIKSNVGSGTSFDIRFNNLEKADSFITSDSGEPSSNKKQKKNFRTMVIGNQNEDCIHELKLLRETTNSVITIENNLAKAKSLINQVDLALLCGSDINQLSNSYKVLNQSLQSEELWIIIITNDNSIKSTITNSRHFVISKNLNEFSTLINKLSFDIQASTEFSNLASCFSKLQSDPDFKNEFHNNILPAFNLAWETKLMNNIKALSVVLKKTAQKHNIKSMLKFSENLNKNILNFNIIEVDRLLLFFKDYCLKNNPS